jgi:predicted lipoprotein with Yx(FWY)xxD motif
MRHALLAVALAAAVPGIASAFPAKIGSTPGGDVLQAPDGRTLYVYDGDKIVGPRGKSSCNKECADLWPPFSAGMEATPMGDWGVIPREDGSRQWTYKGRPLYTFAKETGPNQISGNGSEGNAWHLAKP